MTSTDGELPQLPPRIEDIRPVPTIGRIVHYTQERPMWMRVHTESPDALKWRPTTYPAIVTAVINDADAVSLQVFAVEGVFPVVICPRADEPTEGHWHWPPGGDAWAIRLAQQNPGESR
ncbi:hypothetical protein [Mycolicibacterium fortuitum]|uniref:hypothetical protein n=1 Tax=Mycolicibacterium fortuitum TaxID=1766 RepID=UPI0007EB008D|nr:hypothetical protein [Mycolicibacterium fortuitum]OBF77051.1 hypothetical protein A5751_23000 [Mycolicibacterium fortuitum]